MKTTLELDNKKKIDVQIEPALDKYDNVVLFPKKLEEANTRLKKSGFPKLLKKS